MLNCLTYFSTGSVFKKMRWKVFHIFVYCIVQTVYTPGRLCYSRRFNVEKVPPTVGVRMQYIEIIRKWRCKYRPIKKIFGPLPCHSIYTFTPVVPLHLDALKIFEPSLRKSGLTSMTISVLFSLYIMILCMFPSEHFSFPSVSFHQSSILIFYSSTIHSV